MSVKTAVEAFQVVSLHTLATVSADGQSTGVAISGYKGLAKIVIAVESVSGTSPTLDIAVQGSSDDGSADAYADIATFTQIGETDGIASLTIDLDSAEGYIRLDFDVGGTNPVYKVAAVLISRSEAN